MPSLLTYWQSNYRPLRSFTPLGGNGWYVVNIQPSEVSRGFLIRPSHKYISLQAMPAKPP